MDNTNPIINMGIPVVTSPIIKTVTISDELRDQDGFIEVRSPLKTIKQTKRIQRILGKMTRKFLIQCWHPNCVR